MSIYEFLLNITHLFQNRLLIDVRSSCMRYSESRPTECIRIYALIFTFDRFFFFFIFFFSYLHRYRKSKEID